MRLSTLASLPLVTIAVLATRPCPGAEETGKPSAKPAAKAAKKAPEPKKAGDAVQVRALRISEQRERRMVPQEGMDAGSGTSGVSIEIELSGPKIEAATHMARPKVTVAKDDAGNDLVTKDAPVWPSDDYQKIDRDHMFFFEETKPKDRIRVDVQFVAPPRGSKRIELVEGTVGLRMAEIRDVFVGSLATRAGAKLDDKVLAEAGVSAKVTQVDPKGPDYIQLEVSDPKGRIEEMAIVDADGKRVSTSSGSFSSGDVTTFQVGGDDPLPEGARLRIRVVTKSSDVDVPFRLEKVELP